MSGTGRRRPMTSNGPPVASVANTTVSAGPLAHCERARIVPVSWPKLVTRIQATTPAPCPERTTGSTDVHTSKRIPSHSIKVTGVREADWSSCGHQSQA